ncbi:MAG: glutamate 5-kinase [bacterium]|nr:glutamate 5-kinase [bacterium]
MDLRRKTLAGVKRVVVKIGSGVLTHHSEIIDLAVIEAIASDISTFVDDGGEAIIVTSGAVAAGQKKLGIKGRPNGIPEKQAAAAAGQSTLVRYYENAFEKGGKRVAQILLTGDALSNRKRYLNARNTIFTLLDYGAIPIINENDSVSVDEIKFGDNDNLSAMVAGLADADLLIILTDTEGLFDMDPRRFPEARLIQTVRDFYAQTKGASRGSSETGTGGMITKIEAARKAATFGVPTIIANGERKGVIHNIMKGEELGTFFIPNDEHIKGKKKWIACNLNPTGAVFVDSGAKAALKRGNSLLPSGVTRISGNFSFGDLVEIFEEGKERFACGLVQFDSGDLEKIRGLNTSEIEKALGKKEYEEVVHRDDMVFS